MSAKKEKLEKKQSVTEPENDSLPLENNDDFGLPIDSASSGDLNSADSTVKSSGTEVIPRDKLRRMQKKYTQDAKILNRLFFSRVITKDQFEIAEIKVKERLRIIDDLLAKEEDIENLAKIKAELEVSLETLLRKYKLNESSSCTEEDIADIKRLCSDNILSGSDVVPDKGSSVRDEKIGLLTRQIDDIFNNYIVDLTESAVDQLDRLPSDKESKKVEHAVDNVKPADEKKTGAFSRLKSVFSSKK